MLSAEANNGLVWVNVCVCCQAPKGVLILEHQLIIILFFECAISWLNESLDQLATNALLETNSDSVVGTIIITLVVGCRRLHQCFGMKSLQLIMNGLPAVLFF
jgi:hypothetical protein